MSEDKKCNCCSMMIPQESWKCPCCGKMIIPLKKIFIFIIVGLFLAFIILRFPQLIFLLIVCGAGLYYLNKKYPNQIDILSYDSIQWGNVNAQLICPHCQNKGGIRVKSVKRKKGVSGGKAVAAILTLGITLVATGLSRKEGLTQAHCTKCNSTWDF